MARFALLLLLTGSLLAAEGRVYLAVEASDFTWYVLAGFDLDRDAPGEARVAAYRKPQGSLAVHYTAPCRVIHQGKVIVVDAHGVAVHGPRTQGWEPDCFVIDGVHGHVTRWDAHGHHHRDDRLHLNHRSRAEAVFTALRDGTPLPPLQDPPKSEADAGADDF